MTSSLRRSSVDINPEDQRSNKPSSSSSKPKPKSTSSSSASASSSETSEQIQFTRSLLINTFDSLLLANQDPNHSNQIIQRSLDVIKSLLIGASLGGVNYKSGIRFIKSQNQIELNASLVLLRWIDQVSNHPSISQENGPGDIQRSKTLDPQSIDQLARALILLQGLLHLHPPSQRIFSSEFNLRILLKFLPLALHSSTFFPIALPLLDLLLMTFIDSPMNTQVFESAGGLEILIQAMKRGGLKNELRVKLKVLETLWTWWIDDEGGSTDTPLIPPTMAPGRLTPQVNLGISTNLLRKDSAFSTGLHPPATSSSNHKSPRTPRTPRSPFCSSAMKASLQDNSETPSNFKNRGNSRIRPISLPPPSHSEVVPSSPTANLSEGNDTPKAKGSSNGRLYAASAVKSSTTQQTPISTPMAAKSSSEGSSASAASSRVTKASDAAHRIRRMLENTSGGFVPTTPQHPQRIRPITPHDRKSPNRVPLPKSPPLSERKNLIDKTPNTRQGLSRPSDESDDSDRLGLSPQKLFSAKQHRAQLKQGINTPQRMIRHKQSASLGSIQEQLNSNSKSKQLSNK